MYSSASSVCVRSFDGFVIVYATHSPSGDNDIGERLMNDRVAMASAIVSGLTCCADDARNVLVKLRAMIEHQ
jgi:hypothetical protein